jgi:hypothetical protein
MAVQQTPVSGANPLVNVTNPAGVDPNMSLQALITSGEGRKNRDVSRQQMASQERMQGQALQQGQDQFQQAQAQGQDQFQQSMDFDQKRMEFEQQRHTDQVRMAEEQMKRQQEREERDFQFQKRENQTAVRKMELESRIAEATSEAISAQLQGMTEKEVEFRGKINAIEAEEAELDHSVQKLGLFRAYLEDGSQAVMKETTKAWQEGQVARLTNSERIVYELASRFANVLSTPTPTTPEKKSTNSPLLPRENVQKARKGGEEGASFMDRGESLIPTPKSTRDRMLDEIGETLTSSLQTDKLGEVKADVHTYFRSLIAIREGDEEARKAAKAALSRILEVGVSRDEMAAVVHFLDLMAVQGPGGVQQEFATQWMRNQLEHQESLDFKSFEGPLKEGMQDFRNLRGIARSLGGSEDPGSNLKWEPPDTERFIQQQAEVVGAIAEARWLSPEELRKMMDSVPEEVLSRMMAATQGPMLEARRKAQRAMMEAGFAAEDDPFLREAELKKRQRELTSEKADLDREKEMEKTRAQLEARKTFSEQRKGAIDQFIGETRDDWDAFYGR